MEILDSLTYVSIFYSVATERKVRSVSDNSQPDKGVCMTENRKFALALISPLGITLMGYFLHIEPLFITGIAFTAIVIFARYLGSITPH